MQSKAIHTAHIGVIADDIRHVVRVIIPDPSGPHSACSDLLDGARHFMMAALLHAVVMDEPSLREGDGEP